MRTIVAGEPPAVLSDWLERRRALGQDMFDEVWEGEYHVAPVPDGPHGRIDYQIHLVLGPRVRSAGLHGSGPLNLGAAGNFRVPDGAYLRSARAELYNPTAAIVVEVISPGDESRLKFAFYFRAGVEELLIVDPRARTVEWFSRGEDGFEPAPGSALLDVSSEALAGELDWPN